MGRSRWRWSSSRSYGFFARHSDSAMGFTLIELMIAVAVVAILAVIAIPSYNRYVLRSNRAAAESVMMDMASAQERYMIDNRSYAASTAALGYTLPDTVSSNYKIDTAPVAGPPPGFTVTATPIGTVQVGDTWCNVLTYSSNGTKSANGTTPTTCWR